MHTGAPRFRHPRRQRHLRHGLARRDVGIDPFCNLLPARRLPGFKRPQLVAKAPANRQINVPRRFRDVGQLHRAVMPQVTENRPEELRLRVGGGTQRGKFFRRIFYFQHGGDLIGNRAVIGHIVCLGEIQHQNIAASLGIKTRLGFLPQQAFVEHRFDVRRQRIVRVPRVIRQLVVHGFEGVRQGIEPDHIRRAVGGALGAADGRSRQRIHLAKAQLELLRVIHGGGNGKNADAVGDKIRRVFRAHHALAECGGQKGFELIEDGRIRFGGRNQFDQLHVARRIEKMNAAESVAQRRRKYLGQFGDRQPGGVGRKDGVGADMRCHFFVQ